MSLIKIEHLRKEYPDVTPLKDVSVEINKGDVISVIGPSGTGKSTLLRCLNRLEEPTSGSVTLDGEVITSPSCDIPRVRRRDKPPQRSLAPILSSVRTLGRPASPPFVFPCRDLPVHPRIPDASRTT